MKACFYLFALLAITHCMAQQTFDSLMAPESVAAYKAFTEKLAEQADSIFPYGTKSTVSYKVIYLKEGHFSEDAVSERVYYGSSATVREAKGIIALYILPKGMLPVKPAIEITEKLPLTENSNITVWLEELSNTPVILAPAITDVISFLKGQYIAISFRFIPYLGNQTCHGVWKTLYATE